MNIYLDIETIPSQNKAIYAEILTAVQANFRAPSGMTKEQFAADLGVVDPSEIKFTPATTLKARWEQEMAATKSAEIAEQEYRKTALNGGYGEIFCIGFAIDEDEVQVIHGKNEAETLQLFFNVIKPKASIPLFIGHNLTAFDLRFLWQRAVINNIKPSIQSFKNLPRDMIFDTMTEWAGYGNRISFDKLCKILNVPTPKTEELDGSKVWDFVQTGRGNEVIEYCKRDVEVVRKVYKILNFQAA